MSSQHENGELKDLAIADIISIRVDKGKRRRRKQGRHLTMTKAYLSVICLYIWNS